MPQALPRINPKENTRITMRFGYTARNGSSGKIHVCTINARITRTKAYDDPFHIAIH